MGLCDIFETSGDPERVFSYLDSLYSRFKKGEATGSSGQDFRGLVVCRDPSVVIGRNNVGLFQAWTENRGFSFDVARGYLDNPEQPPPVPEVLPAEIADITDLKRLMISGECFMDVHEVPSNDFATIWFEFDYAGQKILTLRIHIHRPELNGGTGYIYLDEIQGEKVGKDKMRQLKSVYGIHPFEAAMALLIRSVDNLKNYRWEIVACANQFLRVLREKFFKDDSALSPSGEPLCLRRDCPSAWGKVSCSRENLLLGKLVVLDRNKSAVKRALAG